MGAEEETLLFVLEAQNRASAILDDVIAHLDTFTATVDHAALRTQVAGDDIDRSFRRASDDAALMAAAARTAAAGQDALATASARLAADTARASDELRRLRADMDRDADAALRQAAALAAARREADRDAAANTRLAASTRDAAAGSEGMSVWLKGALAAALPLAPAMVAAGGAIAAFGALAAPTISGVKTGLQTISQAQDAVNNATTAAAKNTALKKLQQDWAQLPPVQAEVIRQIQGFQSEYQNMAKVVQPQVLGIFHNGLSAINSLLPQVSVLAQIGGKALQDMTARIADIGRTKGAQEFFQMLDKTAQQVLPLLGQLAGALGGALAGALEALAPAAGPAVQLLTTLVKAVSGPLASVLGFLAKAFGQLVAAVTPLIPPLGQLVGSILKVLMTVLSPLIPVIAQIASQLGGALVQALLQSMPAIQQVANDVAQLMVALSPLIPALLQVVDALLPLIPAILQLSVAILNAWMPLLMPLIKMLTELAVGVIQNIVVPAIKWLVTQATINFKQIALVIGWQVGVAKKILAWFENLPGMFSRWLSGAVSAVSSGISRVGGFFQRLPGQVWGWLSGMYNDMLSIGKNVMIGLWNGLVSMASWLAGQVMGLVKSVIPGPILKALGIGSPSRWAHWAGQMVGAGLANGILSSHAAVAAASKSLARAVTGTAAGTLSAGLTLQTTGSLLGTPGLVGGAGGGAGPTIVIDVHHNHVMSERDMDPLVDKIGRAVATRILPAGGRRIQM